MKKTLHLVAYALISLLVACGGGNAIEDLTQQLENTPQGTGPTFAESSANNATIDAWVTGVLEVISQTNFALVEKAFDDSGVDNNANSFSISEVNATLNGSNSGNVTAKVTASGQVDNANNGNVSATVNSNFNDFSESNSLFLTGTSNYNLHVTGSSSSALFDLSLSGVFTVSGEYGAKMSFDVASTFDLAKLEDGDPNNDDEANVEVQGSAVVISGNDTYQCTFTADTNNDIVSAAHCTKN